MDSVSFRKKKRIKCFSFLKKDERQRENEARPFRGEDWPTTEL